MTTNPNTFWRVLGRLVVHLCIAFGLLIAALVVAPWSHPTAQVLAYAWFLTLVATATMKRPPSHYGSHAEWWRDRANWWVEYSRS